MSADEHTPSIGLSTHRIEAFSDGVFAIVMTLLVFELRVPELVMDRSPDLQLLDALVKMWPKLMSFVLSFVIVGIFWVAHHNVFHYIKRTDRALLWFNNLFLLFVAFIPFPTALLGTYIHVPLAVVPYGLTLVAASSSLLVVWWYATRRRRLVGHDLDEHVVRLMMQRAITAPALYVVAILFSIVNARITLAIYAAIPVMYIMPSHIDQHLGKPPGHPDHRH